MHTSRVCSAQIPFAQALASPCSGVMADLPCSGVMADLPERYNALVTVTRLVGVHPKLGDFRDS